MTDTRKAQLEIGVNAGPAEEGFRRVERAGKGMADAVSKSADSAGKAVDGIASAAEKSTASQERAYGRFESMIRRQMAAQQAVVEGSGKTGEIVNRMLAQGLDPSRFDESLKALRALETAQGNVGISSRQMQAAMRGVPAQFTDIITSLQGGQAPLTVMLQQGGQLKDMFGGVGAAVRALGGYVVGLLNPVTAVIAVLAGIGIAWHQGSKEAEAYNRALILSGNAAGVTSGQLGQMAASMKSAGMTQGDAAEALAIFAQNAGVGGAQLQQFATTAVQFSKATGQSVGDVAKQFAELAKDPLQATLKLNEGMNYLNVATYKNISALLDQGRKAEAAAVAQRALSEAQDAMTKSLKSTRADLGYVEQAWTGITGAAKGAWDAMKGWGRNELDQQLSEVRKRLSDREESLRLYGNRGGLFGKTTQQQIAELREQESILQSQVSKIRLGVELKAREVAMAKALAEDEKDRIKYLTDHQKLDAEIVRQTANMVAAGRTREEIEDRIARIKSSYAQKNIGGENEVAGIRAKIDATTEYIARIGDLTIVQPKLTEAEQQSLKIRRELQGSIAGAARASKELALSYAEQLVRAETTARGLERWRTQQDQLVASTGQSAQSIADQASAQEAVNLVFGKGTVAVQSYTLAQLERQRADLQGTETVDVRYLDVLDQKIAAQRRFVAALQAADYKTMNAGLDEWLRTSNDAARVYADEARLAGLSGLERAKIVAQRQVELRLAREINKIDLSDLDESQKQILRQKARDTAAVASAAATAKAVQDEWTKTADQIGQSLTDALMRGFEAGKGFLANLRDSIVNLFKTMVLRPMVQFVVGGAMGSLGLPGVASAGPMGSTGSMGQLLGAGSTIKDVYTSITSSFSALGDKVAFAAQDIGAWLTTNTTGVLNQAGSSIMQASGSFGAAASYAGGALAGYGIGKAISGQYATALGKNTLEVSGTAIGAIFGGPIGAVIGGAIGGVVNRAFGMGAKQNTGEGLRGTFGAEGADIQSYQSWFQKGGWFRSNKSGTNYTEIGGELDQFLDGALRMTSAATKEYAKLVGLNADVITGFSRQIDISLKGLDAAGREKAIADAIGGFGEALATTVMGAAGMELAKRGETASAALVRLATSLGGVNDVLKSLGQTLLTNSLAGASSAQSLLDIFGGMDAYTNAAGQYLQAYYTDAERAAIAQRNITDALRQYGLALPATTVQYRQLVEAQDLNTDAGRSAYAALLQLAPAFAEVAKASGDVAVSAQEQAAKQEAILSQRAGLQDQIDQLLGNTAALRERERAGLDASNQALYDQIQALKEQQTAAEAATRIAQEQAAKQEAILSQRAGLQDQIDQLLGNTAALRERERNALDQSNRALYDQIQAIRQQQTAAEAAAAAEKARVDAIKSASATVLDEIKRLRGITGLSTNQAFLQAQFATLTGQARAGDTAALSRLPEVSQAIEQASKISASSALDMARMRAWLATSLSDTVRALGLDVPEFAQGGLHAGGIRLVGERGPELEVTGPARYLSAAQTAAALGGGGGAAVAELRALRAELHDLRAEARATAVATDKTARVLDRVTQGTDSLMTQQVTP